VDVLPQKEERWALATAVSEGQEAPDFELVDPDGNLIRLSEFRGRTVVLYFYPKAFSGGCTTQSCALRDAHSALTDEGAVVLGVSVDDQETQRRFRDAYSLPFPVLADEGGLVAKTYGVLGPAKVGGSTRSEARRVTFIIDAEGTVRRVIDPAHADIHVDEVREALSV
jgi:peroxiredoxin Q/BCP